MTAASAELLPLGCALAGDHHPILGRAARSLLPKLLASGVTVHEHEDAMLHAKTSVVDDQWGMTGTSNRDRQSFEHSYEVNLVVEGGGFPVELAALFDADIAEATHLDAERLVRRGIFERLVDRLCALALLVI